MKEFLQTKLGRRFLWAFVFTSLLPLLLMGFFLIWRAEVLLRQQTYKTLRVASEGVCSALHEFLLRLEHVTVALGQDPRIVKVLSLNKPASGENLAEVNMILLRQQRTDPDIVELLIADRNGRVVASSNPSLVGEDVSTKPYFVGAKQSFYPGDVTREEDKGPIEWIMSAPVKNGEPKASKGVVICHVNPASLSNLMAGRRFLAEGADEQLFRMGTTVESYIVNRRGLMITESRSISDAVLNVKVDTKPVRAALEQGKEIIGKYPDYRGVMVDGSSKLLKARNWVVLTEIDFSQAFIPVRNLLWALTLVSSAMLLLVTVVSAFLARKILVPMAAVRASDEAFLRGEKEAAIVPEESLSADEIGDFVRNRNVRILGSYQQGRLLLHEQKERAATEADMRVSL